MASPIASGNRPGSPGPIGEAPLRKALIADDDAETRAELGAVLRPLGFEIAEAVDGAAALHAGAGPGLDILFLDLLMPKLNGLDVLKRLRNGGCATPAVLVTVVGRESVKLFAVDGHQPDAYLEKPFKARAVEKIVRDILGEG